MTGEESDMYRFKPSLSTLYTFFRWALLAALTGLVCGLLGAGFHRCVSLATRWRGENPWLIWLLPAGGVLIAALYGWLKQPVGLGTDDLFTSIRDKGDVPIAMAPLIFVSTFLTHLLGGSAGREGAALQLGGSVANGIGRLLRLDENGRRTMTLIGMGALFSALFGTPVTATVFVMEVLAVGHMMYSSLLPCAVASLTAYGVSLMLGIRPEGYVIAHAPEFGFLPLVQVTLLAALCAGLSVLFCLTMHTFHALIGRWLKQPFIRAAAGGAVIVLLTLLVGIRDYNGAGGDVIERAIGGVARPQDFILKLLFTAITLGSGYKGGEIVPTFFVGATFGCVVGPLIGLDPGFAAAVALAATFCGNTNCPVASVFLAVELFGGRAVPLFAAACAVSYALSGRFSLYHAQLNPFANLKRGEVLLPGEEE